jgi:hypothetical protein
MLKLVMIDVAVCAALIIVAFCAGMLRWRRRHKRALLRRARRGTAVGSAGGRAARREAPLVPGFSARGRAQGPVVTVPAVPDQRAGSRAGRRWPAQQPASGQAAKGPASGWPAPEDTPREVSHEPRPREPLPNIGPGEPRPREPLPNIGPGEPRPREPLPNIGPGEPRLEPGPANPGDEPDQQAAGPPTSSEKISSYYDDADRKMSDYLAERGWPKEPGKLRSG